MTQKQLQGDWEGKAKQWGPTAAISFFIQGIDSRKCCVIPETLIKNFQNNRSDSDRVASIPR